MHKENQRKKQHKGFYVFRKSYFTGKTMAIHYCIENNYRDKNKKDIPGIHTHKNPMLLSHMALSHSQSVMRTSH